MSRGEHHSLIIGGGVIGIACAHYLAAQGLRVTLVDKGRIGGGCSHGNCGLICPSHLLPLAQPGAIGPAIRALVDPRGALRIRPRLDGALFRWLWGFARRCNQQDMLASAEALQPLLASSMRLYEQLIEREGIDCEWERAGLLFVYRSGSGFQQYNAVNELMSAKFDEPARRLSSAELSEFEPTLRDGMAGGWYYEHDAHLRPDRLVDSWRSLLEKRGVRFIEHCAVDELQAENGVATSTLAGGQSIAADSFVIATGAWTPQLARSLQCRVPVQPGKGYSITVDRPSSCPRRPLMFPEHRVVITPFQRGMRVGSLMELSGYDSRISRQRLRLLTRAASDYLRDPLPPCSEKWFGWRPMTFDSLPIIGATRRYRNVFLATGHSMLGVSLAPATGRLISELVLGTEPHLSPRAYHIDRFLG